MLKTTAKADDIFRAVDSFFKRHGLKWTDLKGCTTDGAPAMLGGKSGFQARVKEVAPHAVCMYCIIHRFALSCKVIPKALGNVLSLVVKMINNVKSSTLNTRLFKLLCEDFRAEHSVLLFYTEAHWLSCGNVMKRVFKLQDELLEFFNRSSKCKDFVTALDDHSFVLHIAYLVDIFEALNGFNRSLQGTETTVCEFMLKLRAFLVKLRLWRANIQAGVFAMFATVSEVLELDSTSFGNFRALACEHLGKPDVELKGYFPDLKEEDLIDLQHDKTARLRMGGVP